LLVLVAHQAGRVGLLTAVSSALFGDAYRQDVLGGSPAAIKMGAGYVLYNFPNLGLILAAAGAWFLRRSLGGPLALALACLAAIYFLFAVRYPVPDQFMFFLPAYAMACVLAGVGLGGLAGAGRRRWLVWLAGASVLLTPAVYAAAPRLWSAIHLPVPGRKDLTYRDPARYWLKPWKQNEDSAGQFAIAALRSAGEGGVIIADGTSYWPIVWVQRHEGLEAGVKVLDLDEAGEDRTKLMLIGRPDVFAVSNVPGYYPAWIDSSARLVKQDAKGVLFRVVWHEPVTQPATWPAAGLEWPSGGRGRPTAMFGWASSR